MIAGMALSLESSAAVAVPDELARMLGSAVGWPYVPVVTAGSKLRKTADNAARCARIARIAADMVAFAGEHRPASVWIEEVAFGKNSPGAKENAGLAWAVRIGLWQAGYHVNLVPASQARKVFCGVGGGDGIKAAIQEACRQIGAPFAEQGDCCDAFVVANFGLSAQGNLAVMVPKG